MNTLPEPAVRAVSELELAQLDLRYEGYRLRQPRLEATLLSAIAREGIREPLLGVIRDTTPIVLDGFKRCRAARTLHLHVVPFASWGSDEVAGILKLLRADRQHALTLLEQARFVDELHTERDLSPADIAQPLGRSQAWVTVRLGLLRELSPVVRDALFAGAFPVYSYLYTLRSFRRLKSVTSAEPGPVRRRAPRPPAQRAPDRGSGARLLPRSGVVPAGAPPGPPDAGAAATGGGALGSRQWQRVRTDLPPRSGADAADDAPGHGQESGSQAAKPGLPGAMQSAHRRAPRPGARLLPHLASTS